MKKVDWRIIVGIILLVVGALTLLQSLGVLKFSGSIALVILGAFFAAAGAVFLYVFFQDRKLWWPLIPGCSLIGLAGAILLPMLPGLTAWSGPVFFLGMIALSFWIIYILDHTSWWAIIPGGVLASLALSLAVGQYLQMIGVGAMFLGLAVTFALVALLPTGTEKNTWAWIPALTLFLMSLFFGFLQTPYGMYVWPIVMIVGGAAVLIKALSPKKQ